MHADLAMYEAKQAGGGGWRIFGDADTAAQAGTGGRRHRGLASNPGSIQAGPELSRGVHRA
jgi:hypothetical protein